MTMTSLFSHIAFFHLAKKVNDCTVLTMVNMCQNTQVPGVGRVSLECSNLI